MSSKTRRAVFWAEALEGRHLLSAGDLDTGFGAGGYVLPADQTHDYTIASVLVTADGKTIVAGTRQTTRAKHYPRQMYLEEFDADGSVDASFGDDGIAVLAATDNADMTKALLQSDGKIVVVGAPDYGEVEIARFDADGTLDPSFNTTGELEFQFGGKGSGANDAVLTASNQLVVVGDVVSKSGAGDKPAIARLNADGTFDQMFADKGELIFGPGAFYGVAVRPNGKIVLAGTNTSDAFAFAQLNSDGSIDEKFAQDGFGSYGLGHGFYFERHNAPEVTLLSDGEVLFAGTALRNSDVVRGVILRLTTKGKIDKTFNGGQAVIRDSIAAMTASSKQIYAESVDQTVYRLSMNGTLSPSFGAGGVKQISRPSNGRFDSESTALTLGDGFITTGIAFDNPATAGVVRLMADGSADVSFGTNGIADLQPVGTAGVFNDVTTTAGGKIIAVGETSSVAEGAAPMVEELNSDGSLNTAFGNRGMVLLDPVMEVAEAESVVVDPNSGKIYIGWNHGESGVIVRLNSDGAVDSIWGSDGKVTINWLSGAASELTNLLLQPDGKLLVAGTAIVSDPNVGSDNDFAIARFNSDGTLDTSFDQDGKVATSLGPGTGDNSLARALLYPDGKILLVGTRNQTPNSSDSDLALVRYNSDGSRDTTFGSDGKVFTNTTIENDQENGLLNADDVGEDAGILNNGEIVVAENANGGYGLGLLLYNADGSLNTPYQNGLSVGSRIAVTSSESIITMDTETAGQTGIGRDTSQLTQDESFGSINGTGEALNIDGTGRILIAGVDGTSPMIVRLLGS